MPAEDDVAYLQQVAREFEEGWNHGDVDRIMRFYGERYVDVNLRNPVQSREERRTYYIQAMRRGFRIRVRPEEIIVEGRLAFVRGTIHLASADAQGAALTELRYLEIAYKQPDGSWKMALGMDGPVQEYSPA